MFEGEFFEDMPHGEHKYYYENGRLKEVQYYERGTKTGTWKKYNEMGVLEMTGKYENGLLVKIDGVKMKE
jgi:antitoxin component YwqK of YwqJK toxin-antitoxin module